MATKKSAPPVFDEEEESEDFKRRRALESRTDQQVRAGVVPASGNGAGKAPADADAVLGQGPMVRIGDRDFVTAPITKGRRKEWLALLQQTNKLVFYGVYADMPKNGEVVDYKSVARLLTAEAQLIENEEAKEESREPEQIPPLDPADVADSYSTLFVEMPDEQWEAMAEAIAFPLQRWQPDVKGADFVDDLTLEDGIRILRRLIHLSSGVKQGFTKPSDS